MDPAPVASPQDHIAMKNQELMSLKDELLIQTSELLGVSVIVYTIIYLQMSNCIFAGFTVYSRGIAKKLRYTFV